MVMTTVGPQGCFYGPSVLPPDKTPEVSLPPDLTLTTSDALKGPS